MGTVPLLEDIDAAWLSSCLGLEGDFELERTSIGSGQVAQCHRFVLRSPDGAQFSVVAKTPSSDDTSRSTAALQQLYVRETSFYAQLASHITTRTPHCYYAQGEGNDSFLLLLEDMVPTLDVDQFDGLSIAMARTGLRELAGLHGPTMGDTSLHDAEWLNGVANALRPLYAAVLPSLFAAFLERYANSIDEGTAQFVRELADALTLFSEYQSPHACVTHGDFRTDNLLFGAQGGSVALCVVDWQTVGVGSPMLDVAYFLTTSLSPEEREAHEEELLRYYVEQLTAHGVSFSEDLVRREYARYTLQPVVMLVAAAGLVERTPRGDAMFLSMIERGVRAARQWRAFDELRAC